MGIQVLVSRRKLSGRPSHHCITANTLIGAAILYPGHLYK